MVNHLSNYDFCLHCLEICSHSGLRSSDRGEEAHKYTFIHNVPILVIFVFYRVSEDTSITGLRREGFSSWGEWYKCTKSLRKPFLSQVTICYTCRIGFHWIMSYSSETQARTSERWWACPNCGLRAIIYSVKLQEACDVQLHRMFACPYTSRHLSLLRHIDCPIEKVAVARDSCILVMSFKKHHWPCISMSLRMKLHNNTLQNRLKVAQQ
jgi:hypothetical protein